MNTDVRTPAEFEQIHVRGGCSRRSTRSCRLDLSEGIPSRFRYSFSARGKSRCSEGGDSTDLEIKPIQPCFYARFTTPNSRDYASALAKGARDAGEREILHCCLSSGNQWYDMVDVKGGFLTRLSKAAILASISCPLDHLPAQGGRNGHGPGVF